MKKKTKNAASRNKIRNVERVHLEGLVQRQANELKIKNEQLRSGVAKPARSEEQIHILTKAMESTAEGIFIIDA